MIKAYRYFKWNFILGLCNCVWNCNFKMDLLDFDCSNLFVKKNFPQWYFLGLILLLLFKLSDIWMLVEFHSEVNCNFQFGLLDFDCSNFFLIYIPPLSPTLCTLFPTTKIYICKFFPICKQSPEARKTYVRHI